MSPCQPRDLPSTLMDWYDMCMCLHNACFFSCGSFGKGGIGYISSTHCLPYRKTGQLLHAGAKSKLKWAET